MGIYITGMEMPKEGQVIVIDSSGQVWTNEWPTRGYCRNEKAKAVPIPPHGDLIDRYDLKNKEITIDYDEWDDCFDDGLLFVTDLIDKAPVIIPSDKEGE